MEEQIVIYKYADQEIEFSMEKNVMVNATEMAKIFDAQVIAFLRNADTKRFISECLKSENSHFLGVKKRDDLYYSKQKSGTWMHRILALKFAAWLNPAFELWIYHTIDQLVFAYARQVEETNKERAVLRSQIDTLRSQLTVESEAFRKLEVLEVKERQLVYRIGKVNRNQLNLFMEKEKAG